METKYSRIYLRYKIDIYSEYLSLEDVIINLLTTYGGYTYSSLKGKDKSFLDRICIEVITQCLTAMSGPYRNGNVPLPDLRYFKDINCFYDPEVYKQLEDIINSTFIRLSIKITSITNPNKERCEYIPKYICRLFIDIIKTF